MTIPKRGSNSKYTFFDQLKDQKYHVMPDYTAKKMQSFASVVIYNSNKLSPKHFVQRVVDGEWRIYRDK